MSISCQLIVTVDCTSESKIVIYVHDCHLMSIQCSLVQHGLLVAALSENVETIIDLIAYILHDKFMKIQILFVPIGPKITFIGEHI